MRPYSRRRPLRLDDRSALVTPDPAGPHRHTWPYPSATGHASPHRLPMSRLASPALIDSSCRARPFPIASHRDGSVQLTPTSQTAPRQFRAAYVTSTRQAPTVRNRPHRHLTSSPSDSRLLGPHRQLASAPAVASQLSSTAQPVPAELAPSDYPRHSRARQFASTRQDMPYRLAPYRLVNPRRAGSNRGTPYRPPSSCHLHPSLVIRHPRGGTLWESSILP